MKYAFVHQHRNEHAVKKLCLVLEVARSGYYEWRKGKPSKRAIETAALESNIQRVFADSGQAYGSPRIHAQLNREGIPSSRGRVERLMRRLGLQSVRARRYKRTYRVRQSRPNSVKPNLLDRTFAASAPNTKWVSDITFIALKQGWLHLAVVMDLYSRAIVGWAMDTKPTQELASRALTMACQSRRPSEGLLLHSDQGVQYTSHAYETHAQSYGCVLSMSRKGNCYDNAAMESFFHSLKAELTRNNVFATLGSARQALFKYIELFYNRRRLHSTIGYVPPLEYEGNLAA